MSACPHCLRTPFEGIELFQSSMHILCSLSVKGLLKACPFRNRSSPTLTILTIVPPLSPAMAALCCGSPLSSSPSSSSKVVPMPRVATKSRLPSAVGHRGHYPITTQDRIALEALFDMSRLTAAHLGQAAPSWLELAGSQSPRKASSIKEKLKRQISKRSRPFKAFSASEERSGHVKSSVRSFLPRNARSQPYPTDPWGTRSLGGGVLMSMQVS